MTSSIQTSPLQNKYLNLTELDDTTLLKTTFHYLELRPKEIRQEPPTEKTPAVTTALKLNELVAKPLLEECEKRFGRNTSDLLKVAAMSKDADERILFITRKIIENNHSELATVFFNKSFIPNPNLLNSQDFPEDQTALTCAIKQNSNTQKEFDEEKLGKNLRVINSLIDFLKDTTEDLNSREFYLHELNADLESPLGVALQDPNKLSVVKKLIESGVDLNEEESFEGLTPLHIAVQFLNIEAVKILLAAKIPIGPDDVEDETVSQPLVKITDKYGQTPLIYLTSLKLKNDQLKKDLELKKNLKEQLKELLNEQFNEQLKEQFKEQLKEQLKKFESIEKIGKDLIEETKSIEEIEKEIRQIKDLKRPNAIDNAIRLSNQLINASRSIEELEEKMEEELLDETKLGELREIEQLLIAAEEKLNQEEVNKKKRFREEEMLAEGVKKTCPSPASSSEEEASESD